MQVLGLKPCMLNLHYHLMPFLSWYRVVDVCYLHCMKRRGVHDMYIARYLALGWMSYVMSMSICILCNWDNLNMLGILGQYMVWLSKTHACVHICVVAHNIYRHVQTSHFCLCVERSSILLWCRVCYVVSVNYNNIGRKINPVILQQRSVTSMSPKSQI